jgi:methylenetetrahydrofolate dehydrogenase (NADP+)/methenyltetrahydrofolate cyclohydrolase
MVAKLLEGLPVAERVMMDVAGRVTSLREARLLAGLATILVGDDAASVGYIRKKHEACASVGVRSENIRLSAAATQADLHEAIHRLNEDPTIHGFLLQHPLPAHLDFDRALLEMDPRKDADGLHPYNVGRLAVGLPGPVPATPGAVRAMLLHYGVAIAGRHVVIIGRGPTLGRPLSLLLSGRGVGGDAAVTVVHSAVPDLKTHTLRADIVVSGVGQPGIVTPEMVREGAVVVSAGITWRGKKLLPDVLESVAEKASWITPRLGGVGVMTVAMLLQNTVHAAEDELKKAS